MKPKRILLYVILLVISFASSLLFVYGYGAFQHQRYWNGTIKKVAEVEISLIKGMSSILEKLDKSQLYNTDYDLLFGRLKGKIGVTIVLDGKERYSNLIKRRRINGKAIQLGLSDKQLDIKVYRYKPPTWAYNYKRWISSVNKWNTPRFDYITIPFLISFLTFYLFLYALIWRYRSNYLSKDVRDLLVRMGN